MVMAETFDKMRRIIYTDAQCLNYESKDYAAKTVEALRSLWYIFEDNNILLSEADLKEDAYFTEDIYKKVKEQFLYVMATLPDLQRVSDRDDSIPSPRDALIKLTRSFFEDIAEYIKATDIDELKIQHQMEKRQHRLNLMWTPINITHWEIRQFHTLLPDVTYELDYMRYKNMYETTLSLLNYKIDSVCHPVYRIIPQIGIPTWRMFEEHSDISAFSVKSIAWERLSGLGEMIRNNKISEGDKRQLLIRAFLTYQKPLNSADNNLPAFSRGPIFEEVD